MGKQKAENPTDSSIKTPKIRKTTTSDETQPHVLHNMTNDTQTNNPTTGVNLDQLLQIWNRAKQSQVTLSQDQVQFAEQKNRLAEAESEIKRLQSELCQGKENNEKMAKNIEKKCKMRDAIIEKQNLACKFKSQIRGHIDAITNTQEHCEESQQHLFALYKAVDSKQEEIRDKLIQRFNDQVLKERMELKEQLETRSNELFNIQTKCQQFGNTIEKTTRLICEICSKVKECEIIIEKNRKKHIKEIAQVSETVKDIETQLKGEDETKCKLKAENSESSKRYDELLLKYKALQVTDTGYGHEVEYLKSNLVELKERVSSLNSELNELQNSHIALNLNRGLEIADYRKQIEDLMLKCTEATDKLREVGSCNEELSNTVAKTIEENEKLKNPLKTKNSEIMKIRKDLSNALEDNKKLRENVQSLNADLIASEKQICQNRSVYETYKAKQDMNVKKEAEIRAEMVTTEKQLADKCKKIAELREKVRDERKTSSEQAKNFQRDIREKDELINRVRKSAEALRLEIERKQSSYNEKIQEVKHSSKQCELAGHEKQIEEQNTNIGILNNELSIEKLKHKRTSLKKNENDNNEKEEHDAQVKKLKSNYDDLKEELSSLQQQTEEFVNELQETEDISKAKDTRMSGNLIPPIIGSVAKLKIIPKAATPKPILKSAAMRDSSLKAQKVQFDFESFVDFDNSSNIGLKMFEDAERRYAATALINKPDWLKIQVPMTAEESKTTSSVVTVAEPARPRKFFKGSRMQQKQTTRFSTK